MNFEIILLNIWFLISLSVFVLTGPVVALIMFLFFTLLGSLLLSFFAMDYLAFLLILIYAGALVVLFLFITMFLNIRLFENYDLRISYNWLSLFVCLLLSYFIFFLCFYNFDYTIIYLDNYYIYNLGLIVIDSNIYFVIKLSYFIFNQFWFILLLLMLLLFVGMDGVLYLVIDFIYFRYIKSIWIYNIL